MHYYGITIKATSKKNKKEGIDILDHMLKKICRYSGAEIFNQCYELDSKNLIHLHATIISKIIINPAFYKNTGWHIYLQLCYKVEDWLDYCNKANKPLPHEKMNYFRNNYGFIPDDNKPPFNGIYKLDING